MVAVNTRLFSHAIPFRDVSEHLSHKCPVVVFSAAAARGAAVRRPCGQLSAAGAGAVGACHALTDYSLC